ncbi:hypothetical protein EXN75_16925 [Segatella hominis]|uniref:Uncharacterized protein n=1 Tax=Segatella hominis TaxID=2518605 RepID=A0A4Y8UPY7_9BACT|nr:hypothetical protein EXN75_16925 [Segatella hominis]
MQTKIIQTSAMKVSFQIAECSLTSAKLRVFIKLPKFCAGFSSFESFMLNNDRAFSSKTAFLPCSSSGPSGNT